MESIRIGEEEITNPSAPITQVLINGMLSFVLTLYYKIN
jgi:hypothetical protein